MTDRREPHRRRRLTTTARVLLAIAWFAAALGITWALLTVVTRLTR